MASRKELRLRLSTLQASWPEEDSLRKAWVRQLLEGKWSDKAHDELVTRFLQDHEETETEAPEAPGEAVPQPIGEQLVPGPSPDPPSPPPAEAQPDPKPEPRPVPEPVLAAGPASPA